MGDEAYITHRVMGDTVVVVHGWWGWWWWWGERASRHVASDSRMNWLVGKWTWG